MPNLTVTLSDAQWTAYQAVSSNPSTSDVEAWLKRQLTDDYEVKLKGVDQEAAASTEATAKGTRDTKVAAF
tara:strand:- start:17 stop:229 length:213 start_codon:yes stop_codon:yes gene_type:complete